LSIIVRHPGVGRESLGGRFSSRKKCYEDILDFYPKRKVERAAMFTLFIVLHVIFCIFLILVILLQTGKGGGMGTAFGGASQTVFGPRGAGSFIGKITGVVAGLFMLTSLVLAFLSSSGSSGVADKVSALNENLTPAAKEVNVGETEQAAEKSDAAPEKEAEVDAGKTPIPNDEKTSPKDDNVDKDKPGEEAPSVQ
jgi:preprotein translocase subunit SecG